MIHPIAENNTHRQQSASEPSPTDTSVNTPSVVKEPFKKANYRKAIAEWRALEAERKIRTREHYREVDRNINRHKSRREYAERKAAKGEIVRPYVWREIFRAANECGENFLRRYNSELKRITYNARAAAEGRTVRPYSNLSEMTEDERAAHKREQSTLNKKLNRAKKKQQATTSSND